MSTEKHRARKAKNKRDWRARNLELARERERIYTIRYKIKKNKQ